MAETVAEHLPTSSGPGQGIDTALKRHTLPQHTEVAKLVATTVATVTNLDADIALRTADTAVRYNNLGHHFISGSEQANEKSREKLSEAFEKAWEEATTEVPSMVRVRDRIIEATKDPLLDKAPGLKAEFESKSQKYISLVPTTRFDVATNIPGPGTVLKSGGMAVGLGVKALKMGKTAEVLAKTSRVKKINGRMPINADIANSVFPLERLPLELRRKYPHSVPFTGTGHPDFSRYATKKVKIEMTGNTNKDFKLADQAAGFDKRPKGYTWHHHHDGESMLLVPIDIHEAVRHTGGSAIVKGANK